MGWRIGDRGAVGAGGGCFPRKGVSVVARARCIDYRVYVCVPRVSVCVRLRLTFACSTELSYVNELPTQRTYQNQSCSGRREQSCHNENVVYQPLQETGLGTRQAKTTCMSSSPSGSAGR